MAHPGSDMPSTSATEFIVEAVPIVLQCPADAADASAASNRRPLDVPEALLGSAHPVVVRGDDAGCDEDVLLEGRVGGDVGIGLDLRHGSHGGVVLDEGAAADDHVVADLNPLADTGLVAEDDASADPRAGEDDRASRHDRVLADRGRWERVAARGRARRKRRLLADDGTFEHLDAVAEDRPWVDGCGWMHLSGMHLSHGGSR